MSPKLERPSPPYQQIADAIRERILTGGLHAGDRVPSVRTIVHEYGVAMATAQRALGALRAEGFIRSERGVGSVVTTEEERGRATSDLLEKSRRTGKVYPTGQYARILTAELTKAPQQVADALGVKVGETVLHRVRVIYGDDDKPVTTSTSWFRADAAESAPKLLTTERIRQGTFAYLAAALDCEVDAWQDQLEPAAASTYEAKRLGIRRGTPVLRGRNWVYDDTGAVLEYGESVSPGRVTFRGRLSE